MLRCHMKAMAALALALPLLAMAQIVRPLPTSSLRGEITFGQPPEVLLNGKAARLAPGARIRGLNNMLVLSGALVGQKLQTNFILGNDGLLMNVWLLTPEEIAQTWPKTPTEAATWTFDPISKTWIKP
jgi:hypothetical protein